VWGPRRGPSGQGPVSESLEPCLRNADHVLGKEKRSIVSSEESPREISNGHVTAKMLPLGTEKHREATTDMLNES
jgi:hypothetical protein